MKAPECVRIIQGDLDDLVSPKDTEEYALKNSIELHIIYGVDHRYKNPGELDKIVEEACEFLCR